MKITGIHLTNFKRFTDLQIVSIPTTAKLVLLIGSNGSGKSSVFDAFNYILASIKRDLSPNEIFDAYFNKKTESPVRVRVKLDNDTEINVSGTDFYNTQPDHSLFYGRTSFRQIPRLTQSAVIASYLNSDDLDTYYKVFPMKTYATQLSQRQNISKHELAKTKWFKAKIAALLLD
jgi:AAA15 family ATPase/GTPase